MPLSSYSELKDSILNHIGRPGDTTIPVGDMIALFEYETNRVMRTQNQIAFSTITTVGGTQDYPLPADYNVMLEVKTGTCPLNSMGPVLLDEYTSFMVGQPACYTILGSNILFGPVPDGVYTIKLVYYSKIPALSDTNTTNWLLTNHGDAYLFGALRHSQAFLGADDTDPRLQIWEQRANNCITAIKMHDIRAKSGGTPLTMRSYLVPHDASFPR